MSGRKDGGAAFPLAGASTDEDLMRRRPGMTMRQWYKTHALSGILASQTVDSVLTVRDLVDEAAQFADAMVAEDESQ